MGLFRRKPLHERLAEEGGLTATPPNDPRAPWGEVGIHGVPRPREWDAVASAEAPDLEGDEVLFVVLPDGSLLVDEGVDADALPPLADALEEMIQPPYRAQAVHREGATWAVVNAVSFVYPLPPV